MIILNGMGKDVILWNANRKDHEDRDFIPGFTKEQYDLVYAYLAEHFHEGLPAPELPPELVRDWISY